MTCPACAQAITGGMEYRARCRGCAARAVARDPAMKRVMEPVSAADKAAAAVELRMLIDKTMPGVPYLDARADVVSWWRVDRANEQPEGAKSWKS